jgi:mannose-6-phosphate isomerase-like protein (cupin superfamily)
MVAAITTHSWSEKGAPTTSAAKAYHRAAGTGPAYWGPGDLYTFLATGKETGGAYFQFEAVVPPAGGPPPHIHLDKDESFYVIEGELEMRLGDATVKAKAGDFVNIPRGTAHNFKNTGTKPAKMLATFVPAGMEDYFMEVFDPAVDRNATPPPVTDALIQKLIAAAPKHKLQILPPPAAAK